ncbi:hypothetical protein LINPERHAP1_LOCUS34748 [Linum perenne]
MSSVEAARVPPAAIGDGLKRIVAVEKRGRPWYGEEREPQRGRGARRSGSMSAQHAHDPPTHCCS